MNNSKPRIIAYVGTYSKGESEGIYAFEFDSQTGTLKALGTAAHIENPSYLAISKDNRFLYSVMETDFFNGKPSGAVASFTIDNKTGRLLPVNFESTRGQVPCHICTDCANKYLFAANYRDGTVSAFPLEKDGTIKSAAAIIQHEGCGPNESRQDRAHVHYVTLSPDEEFLCAVDLGIDKIMIYKFDSKTGKLTLDEERTINIHPGSGPRHLVFHPDEKFVYLVNELSSDIAVLSYTPDFHFKREQYISTLPEDFTGENTCAAIHISHDKRFLYASNRGHDSIAVYRIESNGKLSLVNINSINGKDPRDFEIDPTGRFLYAANQTSNTLTSFSINGETGELEPLGQVLNVPSPVCIKFVKL